MSTLTGHDIADAGLTDWAYLRDGLQTRLLPGSYAAGLRLVAEIGAAAEAAERRAAMQSPVVIRLMATLLRTVDTLTFWPDARCGERDTTAGKNNALPLARDGVACGRHGAF